MIRGILCSLLLLVGPWPALAGEGRLTPEHYAGAAMKAQEQGDWRGAVKYWARAYAGLGSAGSEPEVAAVIAYEYGRALGIVCAFSDAEARLMEALALDERAGGPVYMSLVELSRLKFDQKLYAEAVAYFGRAVDALDAAGAANRDPDGFAHFLEEYAVALEATGLGDQARIVAARAERLQMQHSHAQGGGARTAYGSQCASS